MKLFRLLFALILEGYPYFGAVAADLTILDLHIQLLDLGDAQVTKALRGHVDGGGGGLLPRLRAGPYQRDDFVDALCHVSPFLPLGETTYTLYWAVVSTPQAAFTLWIATWKGLQAS